jgi:uncharacterized membrane protein
MTKRLKCASLLLFAVFGLLPVESVAAATPTDSVTLYTPYTNISVPPGQTINYEVDAINNSSKLQNLGITVQGMPRGWTCDLKSGGWEISQLSVLPFEKKSIALTVGVPLKVNKGRYHFNVVARGLFSLPLVVTVSQKGTYKTTFSTDQPNMEGTSKTTFTFQANLQNLTADTQLYALQAEAAPGWTVNFKANYNQVSSVSVDPNKTQSIMINITAPDQIPAGTYKIPVVAQTNTTSANLELDVVITGSYKMVLTTPTGLLSTNITAGGTKRIELLVENTGSSALQDIQMTSATPANWDVKFDEKDIPELQPGATTHIFATIKADKKAIPGDYQTDIHANTPQTSASLTFRISAETSMLWGWIGVLIIIFALGIVYFLFRKYGRR